MKRTFGTTVMRLLRNGCTLTDAEHHLLTHCAIVRDTGFLPGMARVPFLLPRIGERRAGP